jgi:hypothetical protein
MNFKLTQRAIQEFDQTPFKGPRTYIWRHTEFCTFGLAKVHVVHTLLTTVDDIDDSTLTTSGKAAILLRINQSSVRGTLLVA